MVGTHLLAKVHKLQSSVEEVGRLQNHPLDHLDKHIDFMREASNKLGRFINKLNSCIDAQDIQIDQLATMVNDLIGKVEGQQKEIKLLKSNCKEHRKVINTLTVKVIVL
jgi:RNase adaptor protein for sRNA GlmZ degradation